MLLTDEQLEKAARHLCFMRGQDLDRDIGHGAPVDEYGFQLGILLYSPRWRLTADELRELNMKMHALEEGLK